MNIFKLIISFFNPEVLGDTIIDTQVYAYNCEKRYNPDKDPHYWLAQVYKSRYRYELSKNECDDAKIDLAALISTFTEACVPEPDNARALGLYVIYKENPDLISKYPKFGSEYNRLLEKIINLQENHPQDFIALYESLNPVSSKNRSLQQALLNTTHGEI